MTPRHASVETVLASFESPSPFNVTPLQHFLGGIVARHRRFWVRLGQLETRILSLDLKRIPVTAPLFICGLARSGSTLLHEFLSSQPLVATHRMKDYPFIFTPYWWRRATKNLKPRVPQERVHRDRVMVTIESPDAIEEMLWTAFFFRGPDPAASHILSPNDRHPEFESFYANHIRKLLLVEKASRYATKNNYHVARLGYLVRLFPDAKFVIPVREPVKHIASLIRQHRLFSEGHRRFPRSLAGMSWSGHFEFGLKRLPIHVGDAEQVRRILKLWASKQEVRGWAAYWAMIYGYLAHVLASEESIQASSLVIRYEMLCANPNEFLRTVLNHCQLPTDTTALNRFAASVSRPSYYDNDFSSDDLKVIESETRDVAGLWGYH